MIKITLLVSVHSHKVPQNKKSLVPDEPVQALKQRRKKPVFDLNSNSRRSFRQYHSNSTCNKVAPAAPSCASAIRLPVPSMIITSELPLDQPARPMISSSTGFRFGVR